MAKSPTKAKIDSAASVLFPQGVEPAGAKINGRPIDFSKLKFLDRLMKDGK